MATDLQVKLGRLKKRPEFLFVRGGRFAGQKTVAIQARRSAMREQGINVGFTATKRIGNAVVRNRAKRRLREAARTVLPRLGEAGVDYVFIARNDTPTAPHATLMRDIETALTKLAKSPS